jgi:ElaB/YqjD/DUF883 family membrane-anchored ribosome-binding protein
MATESTLYPNANPSTTTTATGLAQGMSSAADDGSYKAPDTGPAAGAAGGDLMRRVVQGAHATIDRLADTAAPAVSRLQDSVSGAGGKLQSGADHVREMGDEWAESLRTTVRENPIASVAVALAAGMLLAKLTSSSRD